MTAAGVWMLAIPWNDDDDLQARSQERNPSAVALAPLEARFAGALEAAIAPGRLLALERFQAALGRTVVRAWRTGFASRSIGPGEAVVLEPLLAGEGLHGTRLALIWPAFKRPAFRVRTITERLLERLPRTILDAAGLTWLVLTWLVLTRRPVLKAAWLGERALGFIEMPLGPVKTRPRGRGLALAGGNRVDADVIAIGAADILGKMLCGGGGRPSAHRRRPQPDCA